MYEARAKEWEKLNDCTQATINRDLIVQDLIKLYGQHNICSTTLDVKFLNEPAEDADGLTRELFSQGWKSILLFSLKVPISTCLMYTPTAPKSCSRSWGGLRVMHSCSLATFPLE